MKIVLGWLFTIIGGVGLIFSLLLALWALLGDISSKFNREAENLHRLGYYIGGQSGLVSATFVAVGVWLKRRR